MADDHAPHANGRNGSTETNDADAERKSDKKEADAMLANGTSKSPLQAAMAELVPKEIAQYAPLLVGKYYVQDKRATWAGRWGMTEAAFGPNGITSAFEMKSDEDVYIRTGSTDAAITHPVFGSGALAKSTRTENSSAEVQNPVYFGYETDSSVRSALPFDCKYSGFFQIQAVKGKPQTVTEKSVEIRFVHDASRPSQFYVSGSGENRFGLFNLVGLLDKETSELRLYKIYKPKEKEKRAQPKRTRAASRPPAPAVPATKSTVVKLVPPPPPPAAAPPVAVAPVTAPPPLPPTAPTLSVVRPSVSTPMGSEGSAASPFVVGRGRSERKRVMPAHLRDVNVIDHDQASPLLKKCHAILKGLMSNPKAGPFLAPVDPVALGIPNYFDVIKEPMDLGTIRQNLEAGYFEDIDVFIDHVRLVFDNAMLYNAAHSQVHIFAAKLSEDFEKRIKNLIAKHPKEKFFDRSSGTPQSSSSVIKLKRERKHEPTHSTKKIKGGRGAKGNSKRGVSDDKEGLIMSLKEDIERLKATLEQLQPAVRIVTPKTSKAASRPFKMEDLTEEELNEPMTQSEKARLSDDIRQLPQDKINRVLQIIAESVPVSRLTNENDEVEIDINSFDTRCLRMLEGYVRENGIGRKRKRPTSKKVGKSAPVSHRLNSAKVAAVNIRHRQQQLKNQLAMMEGETNGGAAPASAVVTSSLADVDMDKPNIHDGSSSDSSSSSSDSSDSDSDSDSESDSDGAVPLQRSPMLSSGASLSQLSDPARADAARKIRDESTSREPLKVENKGAWSLLAQKDAKNAESVLPAEENSTSSLWMSARSMEQVKQQKIQQKEKERSEEKEVQRRREEEQREKERDETERRKREQEAAQRKAQEEKLRDERAREAERARAAQRAAEREKLMQDEDIDEHHDHTLTEDLESFSSSSFL